MSVQAKAGTFQFSSGWSASSTHDFTGLGFDPQVVLFWLAGGATLGTTMADARGWFGASDGTTNVCAAVWDRDNQSTSSCARAIRSDACIYHYSGSASTRGTATCALITDGFRITVTDVADLGSLQVGYLAIGGLTNVAVGASTVPSATGTFDVTAPGFQPDALIAAMTQSTASINSVSASNGSYCLGAATAAAQCCASFDAQHSNASGENVATRLNTGALLASISANSGSVLNEAALDSFLSTGFRLNKSSGSDSGAFIWIALAGGAWALNTEASSTSTGSIARSSLGFQPVGLFAFSTFGATASQASPVAGGVMAVGAATDAAERVAGWLCATDGLATTDNAHAGTDTALIVHPTRTGANTFAAQAEIDLTSLDADGYTLDQQDADTAANLVAVLAVGETGGGLPTPDATFSSVTVTPASADEGVSVQVDVVVRDATDAPIDGATVDLSSDASGAFGDASLLTDVSGNASTTYTPAGGSAGDHTITADIVANTVGIEETDTLTVNTPEVPDPGSVIGGSFSTVYRGGFSASSTPDEYATERLSLGFLPLLAVTLAVEALPTDASAELWLLRVGGDHTNDDDYYNSGLEVTGVGITTWALASWPGAQIRVKSGGTAGDVFASASLIR